MLSRSIAFALAAFFAASPLMARADLYINFKNLRVLTAQRGCHLENANKETKTSTVRCGPYEMTSGPDFTTYTETWGRTTSDVRYGGCPTQSWTRELPPAKHQFDIRVINSANAVISCNISWQNNNTVDVYFIDHIPAQPARFRVSGVPMARLAIYGSGGHCGLASANETVGICKTAGDLTFAVQQNDGKQIQPCKVKVTTYQHMMFVPLWRVEFLSNNGACKMTQVDHYNWDMNIRT